jgi:peptidoglycan-associated lipoprotein
MPDDVRVTLEEHLSRLNDAPFDYDQATLRADARHALDTDAAVIRSILKDYPAQKLIIEGHCDERGSEEYNMALGDRRAAAAKEFLVSMGISPTQLAVITYGKDRPACTGSAEDCWQKNRRAHVTLAR